MSAVGLYSSRFFKTALSLKISFKKIWTGFIGKLFNDNMQDNSVLTCITKIAYDLWIRLLSV